MSATMSWTEAKFTIKDIIQYTILVCSIAIMYSSLKNGQENNIQAIQNLSEIVKEMQSENKEGKKDGSLQNQNLQNQVNTNTQQILLLRQEFELSKKLYYPK